uniref:Carboxylic ester hydrolase n=1 Tax=Ditylenchus dipsaci TaxID=166011 RepID=A0A915CV54_9BILA
MVFSQATLQELTENKDVCFIKKTYKLKKYILGFFALGTKIGEAGNFGLWDQTAALEFVHKRISSFGGDADRVTVFGDSSGSASIHSMSLSPHSHKYFQQTIQSSGSLYNPWSHSLKTIERSKKIARKLRCYKPGKMQDTKDCLKKVDKSKIWAVLKGWGRSRKSMDMLLWGPIMDQDFSKERRSSSSQKNHPFAKHSMDSPKATDSLSVGF